MASAEAFMRHYIDLMNYASQTGSTQPMMTASDPGCERCKEYADFAKKVNEANGGLSGDYVERVKEVSQLTRGAEGRVGGLALVTIGSYTTRITPTASPEVSKPENYRERFVLTPSGSNWVMFEMKLEEL